MYWYFDLREEKRGPVTSEELIALYRQGAVQAESLIYSEALDGWHRFNSIYNIADLGEPSPIRRAKELHIPPAKEHEMTIARPWVRFFARFIDYILFFFLIGLSQVVAYYYFFYSPLFFISWPAATFIWCFIEAFCLYAWGRTPGKALLGIRIVSKSGKKLTYGAGLSRALSVWLLGLGAMMPLINLVTLSVACVKLSRNGITSWDKRGECSVQHAPLTWWRIVIALFIYLSVVSLFVLSLKS